MKQLLLLLALLPFYASAQKVELDKVDEHGDRYIYCSFESARSLSDKFVFFASLNAVAKKSDSDDVIYTLFLRTNANVPLSVPKGGRLLIKLQDDSTIELKTDIEYSDKVGEVRSSQLMVYTNYSITPMFTLTKEQIEMISKGVNKIRLETITGPIDKAYKKDKIGKIVKAEYRLINEALKENKSFNDDF